MNKILLALALGAGFTGAHPTMPSSYTAKGECYRHLIRLFWCSRCCSLGTSGEAGE